MAIDVEYERKEGILIGTPSGRIDTINSEDLQNSLNVAVKNEGQVLLLDFGKVSYVSSSGLRVVLRMAKSFKGPGKKFGICSLTDPVKEVFTVSGFSSLIATYDFRDAAIVGLKNG